MSHLMMGDEYNLKLPYWINPADNPVFPDFLTPDETGLIAVGGELSERTLIEAYAKGIFPWFVGPPIMWFSPDPRLILYPQDFHLYKRLARIIRKGNFSVRFDTDFERVITLCAQVPRKDQDGTWIDEEIKSAYIELHKKYLTHCVSVYREGELCGGLYGVSLGRIFFGESMFALKPDASKIALYYLVEWLKKRNFLFIDCQVPSEHLLKLGAVEIPRPEFIAGLKEGLAYPNLDFHW